MKSFTVLLVLVACQLMAAQFTVMAGIAFYGLVLGWTDSQVAALALGCAAALAAALMLYPAADELFAAVNNWLDK